MKIQKYTIRNAVDYFLHSVGDISGRLSDDHVWSKKYIATSLLESRAIVVKDAIKNNTGISEDMVQGLKCVNLVRVPTQECPCAPPSGCIWLRTEESVPRAIQYISVTDSLGREQYTRKKWTDFKRIGNSRIASAKTKRYYTLKESGQSGKNNHHIYIYAREEDQLYLKAITVYGIFGNPIEAAAFEECGSPNIDAICSPMEVGFYTNEELRDVINKQLILTLPQFRSLAPKDDLNNDKNDTARYEKPV